MIEFDSDENPEVFCECANCANGFPCFSKQVDQPNFKQAEQNSEHVNKCTETAPEVIYLCVSDEPDDANLPYDSHEIPYQDECVTWSRNEPIGASVKYIRADLALDADIHKNTTSIR